MERIGKLLRNVGTGAFVAGIVAEFSLYDGNYMCQENIIWLVTLEKN
jgi:hypothetical protein